DAKGGVNLLPLLLPPGSDAGYPTAPPQTPASTINAQGSSGYGFATIDRVNYPGFGKVKEIQQLVHPLPGHALRVSPARQPLPPNHNYSPSKPPQRGTVASDAVIPKVSFEFAAQLLHLLAHRFVQVFSTPLA